MSVFKCKMCGGDIELSADKTFGTCECCGTSMTFPKTDDEQKLAMFNRGNAFRRAGEFDKALSLYENILRDDESNAEAHWCCALCRFGIEYVEDPATFEYVPTCHRASFDSFLEDVDYKAAVENADGITKRQYQKDAVKIADVQRGILATSQNEEPFDVFICYKENDDATGQRTRDSVDAQEIYYQLTNEGFRVFFARITLEGKAGTEYEPYIFAALNSARVMVVLGSKTEYFNAVWVKNEWSRFLSMMRKDRTKLLLPCYRDIDPYDLPDQLSVLQSYDMSKIGFIQDLIHGIKKVAAAEKPKAAAAETAAVGTAPSSNTGALLERAFLFLEDGKWNEADDYCEKVLDEEPKNAGAYLGKLMAELRVRKKDELKNHSEPFDELDNCKKAARFDPALADKLARDNGFIRQRNENDRKERVYGDALSKMTTTHTEQGFISAAGKFGSISGFRDADEKKKICLEKAETARKDAVYNSAKALMEGDDALKYKDALKQFDSIIDWKDARSKIAECERRIEEIRIADEKAAEKRRQMEEAARIAAEKKKKKIKKLIAAAIPVVCVLIALIVVLNTVIIPKNNLKKALAQLDAGNYDEAYSMLEQLEKDDIIISSKYERAIALLDTGNTSAAFILLNQCPGYKDADDLIRKYASEFFGSKFNGVKAGQTIKFGSYYQSNNKDKEEIEWRVLEIKDNEALLISKKALDCVQYNSESISVTWENCSLRKWLNDTFLNTAFDFAERAIIKESKVSADKNEFFSTNPGSDTTDKIFLLSIDEVKEYFGTNASKLCELTEYAQTNGAIAINGYCWWWLRSPGYRPDYAAIINGNGETDSFGVGVDSKVDCIRPAMWIEF